MNCPDCNVFLDLKSQNGHSAYECYKCKGAWVKKKELSNILSLIGYGSNDSNRIFDALTSQIDQISSRICPDCRTKNLYIIQIYGIELDYCHMCNGLFFDKDELRRIAPKVKKPSPIPGKDEDDKAYTAFLIIESIIYFLASIITS